MNVRYRLARLLIGPSFVLPRSGTWLVTHEADRDYTYAIEVAEYSARFEAVLRPFDDLASYGRMYHRTGTFEGRFGE